MSTDSLRYSVYKWWEDMVGPTKETNVKYFYKQNTPKVRSNPYYENLEKANKCVKLDYEMYSVSHYHLPSKYTLQCPRESLICMLPIIWKPSEGL